MSYGALFNHPKFQAIDSAGAPLSGGKVYFYETGTSTPKDTYTTRALSVANANPVVLDTRGEATIYLNGEYRVTLKSSADATIWGPIDNVVGVGDIIQANVTQMMVDRGDPSAYDWINANFTKDNTWRDLDCSSIVPAGARFISLKFNAAASATQVSINFRKNGNTNLYNVKSYSSLVVTIAQVFQVENIPCDTNRIIEYQISGDWTINGVVITGWVF